MLFENLNILNTQAKIFQIVMAGKTKPEKFKHGKRHLYDSSIEQRKLQGILNEIHNDLLFDRKSLWFLRVIHLLFITTKSQKETRNFRFSLPFYSIRWQPREWGINNCTQTCAPVILIYTKHPFWQSHEYTFDVIYSTCANSALLWVRPAKFGRYIFVDIPRLRALTEITVDFILALPDFSANFAHL